jgi:hypothetical protein
MARGDVQKRDLVGTFLIIAPADLYRITGIPNTLELNTFDHTTLINIETWDDAFREPHLF